MFGIIDEVRRVDHREEGFGGEVAGLFALEVREVGTESVILVVL